MMQRNQSAHTAWQSSMNLHCKALIAWASINERLRKFSLRKSTDEKIVVSGRV